MDAQSYFQSYQEYFWAWETDADFRTAGSDFPEAPNLLSIPHVGTIGYRPYVLELLGQLADDGLPPFGALLLVLYASGNTRHPNFDGLQYHLRRMERNYGSLADTKAVLRLLEHIQQLGSAYKESRHKLALLDALFRNSHHRLSPANSKKILAGIADADTLRQCAEPAPFRSEVAIRDLHTLALISGTFPTAQSLLEAVQEGPPKVAIPEETLPELTAAERSQLIEDLLQNPETFPVAALVRRLWSGLRVQMHPTTPGQQPLGGVSDITTKGPFDRLLLSEFANPDELLLQRLANNEALYVQREIPPEETKRERILLTDVSLQGWGTPKVLSQAAALAIATHPKSTIPTRVFTVGSRAQELRLHNAETVFEGLQAVSATLDSSEGIRQFFARSTTAKEREIFLLMSAATWAEETMQETIRAFRADLSMLILTHEDGTLQLFDLKRGGKRLVQTLVLPLDELWQKPGTARRKNLPEAERPEYPLLLPISNKLAVLPLDDAYYLLSTRKHLYRLEVVDSSYHCYAKGLKPLVRNISFKATGVFALGRDEDGLQLAQLRPNDRQVSILHLATKAYASGIFPEPSVVGCELFFVEGRFYVFNPDNNSCFRVIPQGRNLEFAKAQKQILKEASERVAAAKRLQVGNYQVLNNHTSVGINERGNLQLSHYALEWENQNIILRKNHPGRFKAVAQREGKIFYFKDGSAVHTDSEGMVILRSSDSTIPEIFIPTAVQQYLTLATDTSWAGADLFVPAVNSLQEQALQVFNWTFLQPFMDRILAHES